MAPMAIANSLMLDFRTVILPRFVYASRDPMGKTIGQALETDGVPATPWGVAGVVVPTASAKGQTVAGEFGYESRTTLSKELACQMNSNDSPLLFGDALVEPMNFN